MCYIWFYLLPQVVRTLAYFNIPSLYVLTAQQWPSTLTLIVFVWTEWSLLEGQGQIKTNGLKLPGATLTSQSEFYQVTFNPQGQFIPLDLQCVCLHNLLRSILHLPPSILCVVDKFIRPKKRVTEHN